MKPIKCHIDHSNERWWVLRNGKQTCCCCGSVMRPRKKDMSRKDMEQIKANIADIYPGKRLIVLMPGDPIPKELRPKKTRRKRCQSCNGEGTKTDSTWPQVGGRAWTCETCGGTGLIEPTSNP